ncbi:YdeI/OmpD-associated family protein [Clostridium sp. LP20]|uniref:YdeI/OmpD-associated family protein n=1 Tax=Clostridium sp. LP20 TaxID=3418665 RepID=UPI003EE5879A
MEKFIGKLKEVPEKGGAYIEIPFNVEEVLGGKRVKVKATFDGVEYRGSIVRMGTECHIIGVTKEIRSKMNKDIGDDIVVTIEKDEDERVIKLPKDIEEKIKSYSEVYDFWNSLSFSNKKKYSNWIESAKKEETRKKRIESTFEMLKNKEKLR